MFAGVGLGWLDRSHAQSGQQLPPETRRAIPWRAGAEWLPASGSDDAAAALGSLALRGGQRHFVVQFTHPLTPAERAATERAGLQLLSYLGSNAYFAAVLRDHLRPEALADEGILAAAAAIERHWKLQPSLLAGEIPGHAIMSRAEESDPLLAVYVVFHPDVAGLAARQVLSQYRAVVMSDVRSVNAFVATVRRSGLELLADCDEVQWIEACLPPFSVVNDSTRWRTQAEFVQGPGYGLDGSGVTVLIYDGGTAHHHPDLADRLTIGDNLGASFHATHVAGTVAGNGEDSGGCFRGMAPGAALVSYGFQYTFVGVPLYGDPGDIEHDYEEAIRLHGVALATNSIGTNTCRNGFSCNITGEYGVTAQLIDAIVTGSLGQPFRVIWANGNERGDDDPNCPGCHCTRCIDEGVHTPEGYHSTAPPACAKNHITVGAVNSNDDSVTSFTSWGPCSDGRLKPDIVAPGSQIGGDNGVTSCCECGDEYDGIVPCEDSDGDGFGYRPLSGTSMATPTVAGLAALLLEDYRVQVPGAGDPRNSMLKALFAHNAVDLGNRGPDYQSGYGSVRIRDTIDFLRSGNFQEQIVDQGDSAGFMVQVDPNTALLKVTLAWDDPPGTPNVVPALINDLDLRVHDPNGVRHYPWTLNPDDPAQPATRDRADHTNNIEQVVVDAPAPGRWTVEVVGLVVPQGPQTFSICGSPRLSADCDGDGVPDDEQIAADPSLDCTGNGVLDECEPDCNGNGVADSCDIQDANSPDCNSNWVPDECEPDCNGNGVPDDCDVAAGASDCNGNSLPDECEPDEDCNGNGVQDICDIADGTSEDTNGNGVPDECEAGGRVLYVDDDCDGAGDGSAEDPFCTIRQAVFAALSGDTIVVRDGVYTGAGNTGIGFFGKAITLRSENGPENCIVDGEHKVQPFVFQGGETPAARLEGFTIRNGHGFIFGGGIRCENASPTIANCVIQDCTTEGFAMWSMGVGSGLCALNGSGPVVLDCVFEGNAALGGGAVCLDSYPGPDSHPVFERCVFVNNVAEQSAAAVAILRGSLTTIRDSLFAGNRSPAAWYGYTGSSAIDVSDHAELDLINCTFAGNFGNAGDSTVYTLHYSEARMRNCVLWDDTVPGAAEINIRYDGSVSVEHCNVRGGRTGVAGAGSLSWGDGNIDAEPDFFDPLGRDGEPGSGDENLRLADGSPCIDAGNNAFVPGGVAEDLDGDPRISDGDNDGSLVVDMGAYERSRVRSGDANCDGTCNELDVWPFVLALVSGQAAYEAQFPGCDYMQADVNRNGRVGFDDINPFIELLMR